MMQFTTLAIATLCNCLYDGAHYGAAKGALCRTTTMLS